MTTEPIIWEVNDLVELDGQRGRIESIDRFLGYLVRLEDGSYLTADRDALRRPALFAPPLADRASVDPSQSPTVNYLNAVR